VGVHFPKIIFNATPIKNTPNIFLSNWSGIGVTKDAPINPPIKNPTQIKAATFISTFPT